MYAYKHIHIHTFTYILIHFRRSGSQDSVCGLTPPSLPTLYLSSTYLPPQTDVEKVRATAMTAHPAKHTLFQLFRQFASLLYAARWRPFLST